MFPPVLTVTSHSLQDLGSVVTWHKRFTEIEYLLKDGHAVRVQVYQGYLPDRLGEGKMGRLCSRCVFSAGFQSPHSSSCSCACLSAGDMKGQSFSFGIVGMAHKADCLQKAETVKFQLCVVSQTGQKMACNIVPLRRAPVECVKDQVGSA